MLKSVGSTDFFSRRTYLIEVRRGATYYKHTIETTRALVLYNPVTHASDY
jgi:hypothetical protein